MKITKLGHCCLLIEEHGIKILTDPGFFTVEEQQAVTDISVLLITHEHADHLHVESVQKIAVNNPGIKIITNGSVGKILSGLGLTFEVVTGGQSTEIEGIVIEGFGKDHAEIYEEYGLVENTGYFINNRFFYPGDAFTDPKKPVEILALPVAGPWLLSKYSIDYARSINPKVCFSVHDGFFKIPGPFYSMPQKFLADSNIQFIPIEKGIVGEW
jgi:L-ascorbate metabolism protein UlaG (beta-lactamase superfamily)